MNVEILEAAEIELIDAVAYYNSENEGLGFEFAAEVARTINRILEYPTAWTTLSKRTRRCRTNRFPYGVLYQIRGADRCGDAPPPKSAVMAETASSGWAMNAANPRLHGNCSP